MPELPDLEYIVKTLRPVLEGGTIDGFHVTNSLVLRIFLPGTAEEILKGERIEHINRRGPFIVFELSQKLLVMNLMLTGALQLSQQKEKPLSYHCFTISFKGGRQLNYGDQKHMGKVYVGDKTMEKSIPGYLSQGVDLLSPGFSREYFMGKIKGSRKQARVFIMDQTIISSIGNAYADEILFDSGIHPKTLCSQLDNEQKARLFASIRGVMEEGIKEVERAAKPMEVKVRTHMKVRNRKGKACEKCGAVIRRASVYGYDTFFCPLCQPAVGKQFIQW